MATKPQTYNESNITAYIGLEGIRKKSSMYIGELGNHAWFHLFKEAIDNCVDEFFAGRNKTCQAVSKDSVCVVHDESGGIPVGINKQLGISTLTTVFTHLHAGGKFDNSAFKVSAGCFVGDTKIRLLDGTTPTFEQLYDNWVKSNKPFLVYSADSSNSFSSQQCYHVQLSKYVVELAVVTLSNGSQIKCTIDHPFYIKNFDKKKASDLKPGEELLTLDLQSIHVKSVDLIACEPTPVYGISVTNNHNYLLDAGVFVGNTHGVGNKAITALSTRLEVWTFRDGAWYYQAFSKGKVKTEVLKKKPSAEVIELLPRTPKKGTILLWEPDNSILGAKAKLEIKDLISYLEGLAYLNKDFKIDLRYWQKEKQVDIVYHNKIGPEFYVQQVVEQMKLKAESKPLILESENFDFALQLTDYENDDGIKAYVNSSLTVDGGKHYDGFWSALTKALAPFSNRKHKYQPKDLRFGLIGYLNLRVSGPKFSSQTKEKLVGFSIDTKGQKTGQLIDDLQVELEKPDLAIERYLTPWFTSLFKTNKLFPKAILDRATAIAKAREQSKELMKAASKLKVKDKTDPLPEVLYTATKALPEDREIFILEGDSAGGTAKYARFKEFQEVLKLKGKPLNSARATPVRMAENESIRNILVAIGCDPEKTMKNGKTLARVNNIYMLSDPDPDGFHINVLGLTALWKAVPKLFHENRVHVVIAPLYSALYKGKQYFGDTLDDIKSKLPEGAATKSITRLKGWGEATADELRQIAFDPATRRSYVIKAPKTVGEDEKFFALVGDDTKARKEVLGL